MVRGGVVGGGLVEWPGDPQGSGTVLGYGVVSDPGVSSEVGERPVAAAGAEGSEVSSLGKVGGGVGAGSGVRAGPAAASRVDAGRPGVTVRSAPSQEAGSGLGSRVSAGGEVTSVEGEAAWAGSWGAAWEVTGGPGKEAGGAVLAAVGRSRRSGPGFFPGPGGGKMDSGGQPAPPTPRPGEDGQSGGAEPRDVTSRRQTRPALLLPLPAPVPPLRCLQAPPGGPPGRRMLG